MADCLIGKAELALARTGYHILCVGGGVAANKHLRARFEESAAARLQPSLRQLGCVARSGARDAPPGMVRYAINQPAWADGADTVRFMRPGAMDPVWGVDVETLAPPTGGILLKTFLAERRPLESQMLVRRDDGTREAFPGGPADRWVCLTPGSGGPP